jgi:phage terminase Nu1 subunit (DNA packaging protein)
MGKNMRKNAKMKKGQAPIDFTGALRDDVARLFGITGEAVSQWDCPRDKTGRYDLDRVVQWRMERLRDESRGSDRAGLESEKIRLQCEKLEFEIEERKKNSISMDEHKIQMQQMADTFKDYFTGFGRLNLHDLAGQPIEVLRKRWDNLIKLGMDDFEKKTI